MNSRRSSLIIVGFTLFFLTGCPDKLNETKKFNVGGGADNALDLPGQKLAQTINVEFSSNGGEVSVLLFKEEDAKGENGILNADPAKALGKAMNSKGDKFSAEVPPNTPTRVIIRGGLKPAEVTVTVNNKK